MLVLACAALIYVPPEAYRHEQLTAMQAAFSRFGAQGPSGALARRELPDFLRFVVGAMNSAAVPREQVDAKAAELSERLLRQLPAERDELTLADLLGATEGILEYPQPTAEERERGERGRRGAKQLRKLRKTLERNRLTMPLFDTRGWVRDFEKALKIQWEIYANGLAPMHIVVARSDRIYGTEVVTQEGAQRNP